MQDLKPVTQGQLVFNPQGQLFLKADPSSGTAAIEISKLATQIALRVVHYR